MIANVIIALLISAVYFGTKFQFPCHCIGDVSISTARFSSMGSLLTGVRTYEDYHRIRKADLPIVS